MVVGTDWEVELIPLDYLTLRLARRIAPERVVQFILNRRLGITPGTETSDPARAARRYQETLAQGGRQMVGASVFVLGYGGYYGLAVELLRAGARHVTVCDPYAVEKAENNAKLAEKNPSYFMPDEFSPNPAYITTIDEDVRRYADQGAPTYDLILSWSVFEHLDDPPSIVAALSRLTANDGFNIHFIDMRDHYFKYPFEMYCHSEALWGRWLNPSSNLNRWRSWQYETTFKAYFDRVRIFNLESEEEAFKHAKDRMLAEFKTGDDAVDSVTRIQISASKPRRLK
jgi:SAM-dependent methyltransferase